MGRRQKCVLAGLARNERLRLASLFDFVIPSERRLQVIIDQETHIHGVFILDLADRIHQLWLQANECVDQISQSFVFFAGLHAIDDFIRQVDVAFDQVHISD